jgi:opacity protein-like surface antigen
MVVGVLIASCLCAYGQVEDSATAGVIPMTVGGYFSYFDASYASYKTAGLGAVLDYSPLMSGDLGVEGESRWLKFGGDHGFSEYNYLVGPRYRFYKSRKYQPYAKILAGAGLINFPFGLAHGGYFAIAPGAGADVALNEHWKVRLDYEFQYWPSAVGIPGIPTGSMHPNGASVGLTYRLFRSRYVLQPHY